MRRRRPGPWLAAGAIALISACGGPAPPPSLAPALRQELAGWLAAHGRPPAEFVVGLFADHDVVFLGERHRIRDDLDLVRSLPPRLYGAGVRVLVTEFARREDQPLLDSLMARPDWDEALARRIVFQMNPDWGFQEYVDVFHAAWEVNRGRAPGQPRFRVLGMNDSPDWSQLGSAADRNNGEVMRRVWKGQGEHLWARVILDAVRGGDRVLVHCGSHHAFTRYRQPIVLGGAFRRFDPDLRAGNHVREALGERVATVMLHSPWAGDGGYDDRLVHPAGGAIDALMLSLPGGPRAVGFRVPGTPFGRLRPDHGVYRHGDSDFQLEDFCDGWIYTRPISEMRGVTAIPDWINESNLAQARRTTASPQRRGLSAALRNALVARTARDPEEWRKTLR